MQIKKIFILIISIFAVTAASLPVCYADNDIDITQAYVNGNYIDVFIPMDMKSDVLSANISTQSAALIDSGSITDKGISVYTTILLDISTSMPLEARDKALELLNYMIENISSNEKFKIVTFGEEITILQDFTSDRYDLSNSINKIEFKDKQTKIYDTIYNTMPEVRPLNGEPCYYRTIVISDGADVTLSGVTKEELYMKLQSDLYPVYAVNACKTKQTDSNKELSALARISRGQYFNIYPEIDIAGFASSLSVNNIFWCRVEIPSPLLDGSTRQVNMSDGINSVQFDIKIPVYNMSVSEVSDESMTIIEEADEKKESSDNTEWIVFTVMGAAILLMILITASIVIVYKRKSDVIDAPVPPKLGKDSADNSKTELFGQFIIKISNVNCPSDNWKFPIDSELSIGRSSLCGIQLNEQSVSHEQCKIIVQGSDLAIVNLSKTNKTLINGTDVTESVILHAGDIIKMGRVKLRIDYIQSLGERTQYYDREDVLSDGDTESIF